jgi:hypothetical protein
MFDLLVDIAIFNNGILGGIAVLIILGYALFYFLPHHLMIYVQDTTMSSQIAMYDDHAVIIFFLAILLMFFYIVPVLVHDFFNTQNKKILGIFFCSLPTFLVVAMLHSTSSENYVKNEFNEKYEKLNESNIYFRNSTEGKSLRAAIDNKDYATLNAYYPKGSRDIVNKKVEGLSANTMIDKMALVNEIGIPELVNQFKIIRKDNYVTLEEYETFKKYALAVQKESKINLSSEKLTFLHRL